MKVELAIAFVLIGTATAWCQGTVNFANGAAGVDAPVISATGHMPIEGSGWLAELWVTDGVGEPQRLGQPVPFLSGAAAGYFLGGAVAVPGIDAGQEATFRVRAFNTNSASEGFSNPVTLKLGGGKLPPANLVGLQSWSIPPIPQLTIAAFGNQASISWSTNFPGFAVESSGSLARANWDPVTPAPQTNGACFEVIIPLGGTGQYYRLRSN